VSNKVQVKKVKPYPFPAGLDHGGAKLNVEIMKLTQIGFIARLDQGIVHVGGHGKCSFELPVIKRPIESQVRVLKTYDRAVPVAENKKDTKVERLAEFHFNDLPVEHTKLIELFMRQIGQK
jgi:hypothetical protein